MRAEIIREFVTNITSASFNPPRGMDEHAQMGQVAEMYRAACEAVPHWLNDEQVENTTQAARSKLLRDAKSRAWPIISEVVAALKWSLPRREAAEGQHAEIEQRRHEIRMGAARNWWAKHKSLPKWLEAEPVVRGLIADGIPAKTLWRAHVWVPGSLRDWPGAPRDKIAELYRFAGAKTMPHVADWVAE